MREVATLVDKNYFNGKKPIKTVLGKTKSLKKRHHLDGNLLVSYTLIYIIVTITVTKRKSQNPWAVRSEMIVPGVDCQVTGTRRARGGLGLTLLSLLGLNFRQTWLGDFRQT